MRARSNVNGLDTTSKEQDQKQAVYFKVILWATAGLSLVRRGPASPASAPAQMIAVCEIMFLQLLFPLLVLAICFLRSASRARCGSGSSDSPHDAAGRTRASQVCSLPDCMLPHAPQSPLHPREQASCLCKAPFVSQRTLLIASNTVAHQLRASSRFGAGRRCRSIWTRKAKPHATPRRRTLPVLPSCLS